MPTSQPTQQQPLAAIFAEYTSCPQHRPIIVGLSLILQTITLRCPSALVWINIGEGKSAGSPGSPLDILPCAPSSLPLPGPPTMQNHHVSTLAIQAQFRKAVKQKILLDKFLEWLSWAPSGPNFIELLKHNKIMLTRIRLPANLPWHMYNVWLVSCLFLLSQRFLSTIFCVSSSHKAV